MILENFASASGFWFVAQMKWEFKIAPSAFSPFPAACPFLSEKPALSPATIQRNEVNPRRVLHIKRRNYLQPPKLCTHLLYKEIDYPRPVILNFVNSLIANCFYFIYDQNCSCSSCSFFFSSGEWICFYEFYWMICIFDLIFSVIPVWMCWNLIISEDTEKYRKKWIGFKTMHINWNNKKCNIKKIRNISRGIFIYTGDVKMCLSVRRKEVVGNRR